VLARRSYSPEQIMWFVVRFGPSVGARRDQEMEACGEAAIAMDKLVVRRRGP